MKRNKPTRAARRIAAELSLDLGCGPRGLICVAHMIDREAHLPELLMTGHALLTYIDECLAGIPSDKQDAEGLRLLADFRAALTAAKGG